MDSGEIDEQILPEEVALLERVRNAAAGRRVYRIAEFERNSAEACKDFGLLTVKNNAEVALTTKGFNYIDYLSPKR